MRTRRKAVGKVTHRMSEPVEVLALNSLLENIESLKSGLDPEVLESWYRTIELESKAAAGGELASTIEIVQDPVLWMRFHIKASRRAIPFVLTSIEQSLPRMPLATRLYFQKLQVILVEEYQRLQSK